MIHREQLQRDEYIAAGNEEENTAEKLQSHFVITAQAEGMAQNEMVPSLKGHCSGFLL